MMKDLKTKMETQMLVNKTSSFLFSEGFNFSQQIFLKSLAADNHVQMNSACLQKFTPPL